jgi:hypothetical protein
VFNDQGDSQQLKLFPSDAAAPADDPQVARVLLNKVRLERTRQFGSCFLGLELWKRLELDRFFEQTVDHEEADVPWSRVAALLAINRLCAPGSELAIEQRWYPSTAMDDLLKIEEGKINDTRLYRCLDRILPHKTKLERHLKERYGVLFGAEFDVLLYDLTGTYVEGAAEKNPMVRRGYSRDHRPDCEQLVIALIVNNEEFPFSYETFDGNRSDVSTMETILRMVERKYGKARRIRIFDRGIVSEENLAAIRKRGGQYLTGTPRSQMKQFEAELLKRRLDASAVGSRGEEGTDTKRRRDSHSVPYRWPRGEREGHPESFLQPHGDGVERPGESYRHGATERPQQNGAAAGQDPGPAPAGERSVRSRSGDTPEGVRLFWEIKEDRKNWRESREGAYLLRTNLQAEPAEELWAKYMQLTEAESSFRALKSELSIRPLFHQLEPRVRAHVMVAFLGYALWVTLKHLLKRHPAVDAKSSVSGADSLPILSPMKAIALLYSLQSADIILPTTDGREIRLRRITEPTAEQKSLLRQLGMSQPEHLQFNRQCSVDSATA